jgi:CDP-paratose 2-epimerase
MDQCILVTGSSGLIGSEVVDYFCQKGQNVYGVDNNGRAAFFGEEGDTRWNQRRLESLHDNFTHVELDIRHRAAVLDALQEIEPDAIVHTAAQPSHDKAADIPFEDFDTNAVGTVNLLEATRRHAREAPFVHLSTNKVYGDRPNTIELEEQETRYDYADPAYENGIDETFPIDQSKHSLFGASKTAGDVMVQEYGRYFDMKTCCLRGGCLTGPNHAGVELHGFLSYLIKCNLTETKYTIFGYKGKQVRDNIHSLDVARFIECFIDDPRVAEVYNLGGGFQNSCSILEAFELIEDISGKEMIYDYDEEHRSGDHICYYSDLSKMKSHYPEWGISKSLEDIFQEIRDSWVGRSASSEEA